MMYIVPLCLAHCVLGLRQEEYGVQWQDVPAHALGHRRPGEIQ